MFFYASINPITLIAAATAITGVSRTPTDGVLVTPTPEGMAVVATNGAIIVEYTLSRDNIPATWIPQQAIVIHFKAFDAIRRFARAHHKSWINRPQNLSLSWDKTRGVAVSGSESLTMPAWDVQYPSYERVFLAHEVPSPRSRFAYSATLLARLGDLLQFSRSSDALMFRQVAIGSAAAVQVRPFTDPPLGCMARALLMGITMPEERLAPATSGEVQVEEQQTAEEPELAAVSV
jgi:hypothetical protein